MTEQIKWFDFLSLWDDFVRRYLFDICQIEKVSLAGILKFDANCRIWLPVELNYFGSIFLKNATFGIFDLLAYILVKIYPSWLEFVLFGELENLGETSQFANNTLCGDWVRRLPLSRLNGRNPAHIFAQDVKGDCKDHFAALLELD